MLEEAFDSEELVQKIEGQVTAELFDAKTGELVQREETHNFISQPAIAFLKQAQRTVFKQGIYTLNSSLVQDYQLLDKSDATLVLTDLTDAEDPANETHMYGRPIGWASKTVYSGSDTLRGTVNAALSQATSTYCKWVFDWPTNAANGTIASIGWSKSPTGGFDTSLTNNAYSYASASTLGQVYSSSTNYNYLSRASSSVCYAASGSTIYTLNASFVQSSTFSVSAQMSSVNGIAWDSANNKLWVAGTFGVTSKIASYNASGTLIDGPFTTARQYAGLAYDGQYLWGGLSGNPNHTLYRINSATGAEVSNFTFPAYTSENIADLSCSQATSTVWVKVYYGSQAGGVGQTQQLKAFNYTGQPTAVSVSVISWSPTSQGLRSYGGAQTSGAGTYDNYSSSTAAIDNDSSFPIAIAYGFDVIDKYNFLNTVALTASKNFRIAIITADGLGSRALLPTPIAKTSSQTLRITYQMNYS